MSDCKFKVKFSEESPMDVKFKSLQVAGSKKGTVRYDVTQELTETEQRQARENIGVEQADWNENDENSASYIKNKSLEIPAWNSFAFDTWADDYSYFKDGWLTYNFNADIALEINGQWFEHLPFESGGMGAFTYGNVDTIGVKISNSGLGTYYQYVSVSPTMFPDGIKSAKVYRWGYRRMDETVLPESVAWASEVDPKYFRKVGSEIITATDFTQYYSSNTQLRFTRYFKDTPVLRLRSVDNGQNYETLCIAFPGKTRPNPEVKTHYNVKIGSNTVASNLPLMLPDLSREITKEEVPEYGSLIMYTKTWDDESNGYNKQQLVLLNPLPTKAIADSENKLRGEFGDAIDELYSMAEPYWVWVVDNGDMTFSIHDDQNIDELFNVLLYWVNECCFPLKMSLFDSEKNFTQMISCTGFEQSLLDGELKKAIWKFPSPEENAVYKLILMLEENDEPLSVEKEPILSDQTEYIVLKSSTPDSTKQFRITVDDSGTISSTEITE